jgi:hypothetical protein
LVAEATEKQKLLVTLTHSAVEKHQTNRIMESVEIKEVVVYIVSQFYSDSFLDVTKHFVFMESKFKNP